MSLLEKNIIKKRWVDEVVRQIEFDVRDNNSGKYKVKAIRNIAIYAKEADGYLSKLYYLIA